VSPRRALPAALQVAEVPEVVDTSRDARLQRLAELWASGDSEARVVRTVVKEFAVTPAQVRLDLGDLRDELRRQLDDEGAIDRTMAWAAARSREMAERFRDMALEPIPTRILQFPSPDPDNPHGEGAVYRDLTPAEYSALMTARTAAGRMALASLEFNTKLLGRRSARWADKPSNVIAIAVNKDGLSEADMELLRTLGMDR
jgi:hypothetical protein